MRLAAQALAMSALVMGAPGALAAATPDVGAEPVARDAATLFLADYDAALDASFARGDPSATGSAALVAGRFGRGLLAAAGPLPQESASVFSLPFFRYVRYRTDDNIDPHEGTLEMWVQPRFTLAEELKDSGEGNTWHGGNNYYLFHLAPSAGNRDIALYVRENSSDDGFRRRVVFREMFDRQEGRTFALGLDQDVDLEGGQWYHVAVAWSRDSAMRALYLNGREIARVEGERETRGGDLHAIEGLPSFRSRLMAIGSMATRSNRMAEAVLDEVQISARVRYDGPFTVALPDEVDPGPHSQHGPGPAEGADD